MAASNADRLRASRYRRAANLGPAERDWLAGYDASTRKTRVTVSSAPRRVDPMAKVAREAFGPREGEGAEAGGTYSDPKAADKVAPDGPSPYVPPAAAPAYGSEYKVLDFGAELASIVPHEDAAPCNIGKDCPRCRAGAAALVCTKTGKPVYPKMSAVAAAGMSATILGGVCMTARHYGRDVAMPDADEMHAFGEALREVIYQRAGVLGADADILALIGVCGGVAFRIAMAPPLKKGAP